MVHSPVAGCLCKLIEELLALYKWYDTIVLCILLTYCIAIQFRPLITPVAPECHGGERKPPLDHLIRFRLGCTLKGALHQGWKYAEWDGSESEPALIRCPAIASVFRQSPVQQHSTSFPELTELFLSGRIKEESPQWSMHEVS